MVVDDVNVRARGLKYALVTIVWCFLWEVFCYESSTCLELFKVFLDGCFVVHGTKALWFGHVSARYWWPAENPIWGFLRVLMVTISAQYQEPCSG